MTAHEDNEVVGARRYDLMEMAPDQALTLLTQTYPGCVTERDRQQAAALVAAVGNLSLALELLAAQLADGIRFAELLEDLQAEVARLETIDWPEVDRSQNQRQDLRLLASLNLSLQRLSPEQQRQFAWLGLLPEGMWVTEAIAATLWELTSQQAQTVLQFLASRALLWARTQQPGPTLTYRLPPGVIYGQARHLLTRGAVPELPPELPGLGLSIATAHSMLLDRYRTKTQQNLWHTLPDDGYIHTHLTWNLQQAGRLEEIHQLLQAETPTGQNGWYEVCKGLGKTASFITDVARAWHLAENLYDSNPTLAIGLQCRYILILASLNTSICDLPPVLIAALVEKGYWQSAQGLALIRQMPGVGRRTEAIKRLVPYLPELLFPQVLDIIWRRQLEYDRGETLKALVPYLPESLLPQALDLTRQIQNEPDRIDVLNAFVPRLPDLAAEVLDAICQSRAEDFRFSAFKDLVPHLPESLFPQVLEIIGQLQEGYPQCFALDILVPHLPESLLPQALDLTRQIQAQPFQVLTFRGLLPRLPDLVTEALDLTRQIQDSSFQISGLKALLPYLPESLLPQALDIVGQVQDESSRVSALNDLVPYLPKSLLPQTLEITGQIQEGSDCIEVLDILVPRLPESLLPRALDIVSQIQTEFDRADGLTDLVPHLPESLLPRALEISRQIQDVYYRAEALTAFVPRLPELLTEASDLTRQIQDLFYRTEALRALVPYLPELGVEALDLTHQIQKESDHPYPFMNLLPYLPESLFPQALDIIRQFQKESDRVNTLTYLVPHLPESLFPQALDMTRQIQKESDRVNTLRVLLRYLPESLLHDALDMTRQVQNHYYLAQALQDIVARLTPVAINFGFWQEALHILSQLGCHQLSPTLVELRPFIAALGGPEAFEGLVAVMHDSHHPSP